MTRRKERKVYLESSADDVIELTNQLLDQLAGIRQWAERFLADATAPERKTAP